MIWLYDASFEGFASAIYAALSQKDEQAVIQSEALVQLGLEEVNIVPTEMSHYDYLIKRLEGFDKQIPRTIYKAWLSKKESIDQLLLAYIRLMLRIKKDPSTMRYDDLVRAVLKAANDVGTEAYYHVQFIRFRPITSEIYIADIDPAYDILLFMIGEFQDRLAGKKFLIRDRKRGKCLVCDGFQHWLSTEPELLEIEIHESDSFSDMWKTYFKHIAIPERTNPKLQTQKVPRRYRKLITEFQ